jgi:hypothetical protein
MKKITLYTTMSLLLTAFALLSVACGSVAKVREAAARATRKNDLMQIGLGYQSYCLTNNKGPASADDLVKDQPALATMMQKVKDGEYTIIWNVNLNDKKQFEKTPMFETILGYETVPLPEGPVVVVMCDGAGKFMTTAEFNAAPKAQSGGKAK